MSNAPTKSFTHTHVLKENGTVEFRCSADSEAWPWLKLPVHHPTAVQAVHFWASVGASIAAGTFDTEKWSALTWTQWEIGERDAGQPVRGRMVRLEAQNGKRDETGERLGYQLAMFDAEDRLAYEVEGKGVIFRTRDFPAWRSEAKSKAGISGGEKAFAYAPSALAGIEEFGVPLLSPLQGRAAPRADALITAENGLPPGHPYLDGSGDHVNSTHLSEAATQFLSLCREGAPFRVTGGEMRFTHYVELGVPFTIEQAEKSEGAMAMQITQNDTPCCIASLRFEKL
ncbi:hypothetical protein [Qipengyuania sp. DGS5-3]|uniref:hypothetical protein n=1 Tax=Qipengyuania sp. DGS5-3 TaxID=3349632 RepID=UPI0036D26E47